MTEIPGYLFSYTNHTIENIRFSPNITTIGNSAFNQSLGMTSISIPEGITEIGSNAFYGCKSLKEVYLPSTLQKIYTYGFSACSGLSVVYCFAMTPPKADGAAYSYDVANARLRVPSESVEQYKNSATWKNFGEILSIDESINPLPNLYSVNINFPEGGRISHQIRNGESFSFFVFPSDGWTISSVSKNGDDITASLSNDGKLTIAPVKEDTDINIVFKKDSNSSITSMKSESDIKISYCGRDIVISGNPMIVSLYDITGNELYSGHQSEITVPSAGIYILIVDGQKFKFYISD